MTYSSVTGYPFSNDRAAGYGPEPTTKRYVVRVAVGDYMGDDVIVSAESPEDAKAEAEELVKSWSIEALSVREAESGDE